MQTCKFQIAIYEAHRYTLNGTKVSVVKMSTSAARRLASKIALYASAVSTTRDQITLLHLLALITIIGAFRRSNN